MLSDDEVVAGYFCEWTGNHGETTLAQPFVRAAGKFHWLPKGAATYGHVFAGNSQVLVGDVLLDYKRVPVKWTPDAKLGWAKPKLTRLGSAEGCAVAVAKDGTVLVHWDQSVAAFGPNASLAFRRENFDVVGIDNKNRVWGNAFRGRGFGGVRTGQSAATMFGSTYTLVSDTFILTDVNSFGDACGDGQLVDRSPNPGYPRITGPVAFVGGQITKIETPTSRFQDARAINDLGVIVGSFNVGMDRAKPLQGEGFRNVGFIWDDGNTLELPLPAPDVKDFTPSEVNRAGTIVGTSTVGAGVRLYLMRKR